MKNNTKTQQSRAALGALPAITAALLTVGVSTVQASTDYGPAILRSACSGHWNTSGSGHKFLVIHDMEGYYAYEVSSSGGLRSCSTTVSVHYGVNGKKDATSDYAPGEVTQFVREAYYAWHARCWNGHSAGTEHEGFRSNPAWYTDEMYQNSAALQRHLADHYGIAKDRNHIVGHDAESSSAWVSYANSNLGIDATCNTHDDPGPYWNWSGFMELINTSGNTNAPVKAAYVGGKDIFWYAPGTAADNLWYGKNPPTSESNGSFNATGSVSITGNYVPIPGDFNGDGKGDIFWYGPGDDTDSLWMGTTPAGGVNGDFLGSQPVEINGNYIPIAGDFNGDGKTDIFWYGPGAATDTLWLGRGTNAGGANGWFIGSVDVNISGTYTPIVGDFNGDGADDIFWYGPGTATDTLWLGRTNPVAGQNGYFIGSQSVDINGTYTPIAGDFNGDGKTDIFWYGPGSATDTMWLGRGTNAGGTNGWFIGSIDVAISGTYTPIVGDFNSDGADDIFWYGYGTATDTLWRGKTTPSAGQNGYFTGSIPVEINGNYIPFSGKF